MKLFLCYFVLSWAFLFRYDLAKQTGKLIYDYSGHHSHGILGHTLASDFSDCRLTNRGVFMSKTSKLTLPPNEVSQSFWDPHQSLSLIFLIRLNTFGQLLSMLRTDVKIRIFFEFDCIRLNANNFEIVSKVLTGKF